MTFDEKKRAVDKIHKNNNLDKITILSKTVRRTTHER